MSEKRARAESIATSTIDVIASTLRASWGGGNSEISIPTDPDGSVGGHAFGAVVAASLQRQAHDNARAEQRRAIDAERERLGLPPRTWKD